MNVEDSDCYVSSFTKLGWWDIDKLQDALSEDLVQQIISLPVDFLGSLTDAQIWKLSPSGSFSVKSAYNLFFRGYFWSDFCWKVLWKLKIPPKLQYFMWLAAQGKILTSEQKVRRQQTNNSSCGFCSWPNENVLHILRDCERAIDVWNVMLLPNHKGNFFHLDLGPWLHVNLLSTVKWFRGVPWITHLCLHMLASVEMEKQTCVSWRCRFGL